MHSLADSHAQKDANPIPNDSAVFTNSPVDTLQSTEGYDLDTELKMPPSAKSMSIRATSPSSPVLLSSIRTSASTMSSSSIVKMESASASLSRKVSNASSSSDSFIPSAVIEARRAREISLAIDKKIEIDRRRMIQEKDDPRLLILGSGDSGKTTLLKQMRLFYGEGFTLEEIEAYRLLLLENVINCMSAYLALCDHLNLPIIHQHERLHYVSYSHAGRSYLPADLPPIISILWNEPSVQQVVLLGPNYHIQDTAPYFLSRVETIGKVGYKPTNQDILHVRAPTLAVSETIFKIGIHHYRLFDVGGQRGLRKQWAPFFDNCHSILFVTSIASYDQTLEEEREHSVNRLHDAIELFGGVINNRILQNSEVLLFLNKKDIFEEKLKHLPFSKFFPRYRGPNDPESIARYVAALFKAQRWDQNRKIMIHRTCCTDTRNMELVVARLIEGLTKSALSRIGTI